ncbi:hypothetical protein PRIPAC_76626, partial [Pristionchus pacificus]
FIFYALLVKIRRMSINVLALSSHSLGQICNFLNVNSILQLRMVSQQTKDRIRSIVTSRKTREVSIIVFHHIETEIMFTVTFNHSTDFLMWKLRFIEILDSFGIPSSAFCRRFDTRNYVRVLLHIDQAAAFLTTLKPLFHTLIEYIESFGVYAFHEEFIRFECIYQLSDFLEGRSVKDNVR